MRVVVILVFAALALRLIGVQMFASSRYSAMGAAETDTTVHEPAVRGGIYDRNGSPLALSVPRSNVVADPFLIHHPVPVAHALTSLLRVPTGKLMTELTEHSGYVFLAKEVGDTVAKKVTALTLPGINVLPATERMDPAGSLAAPLIGAVGAEGSGQSGLEYRYNSMLAGKTGFAVEEMSPDGVPLPGKTTRSAATVPGTGVELTIDEPLQYVTEQSLGAEILASHAKSGIAIVMNTRTGDILSMANLVAKTVQPPTPKPAPPAAVTPTPVGSPTSSTTTTTAPPPPPPITTVIQAPQNLALTQVYEPGSVFKVVTFSAALQDGIISPDEVFTVPNTLTIDGWVFHDAENHPTERLTATQILAQSSNIGTIEIAQQLGEGRLAAQIATLGFGRTTGLGLPGRIGRPGEERPRHVAACRTSAPHRSARTTPSPRSRSWTWSTPSGPGECSSRPDWCRRPSHPTVRSPTTRSASTHRALTQAVASQLTTMMEQVVQDGTAVTAGVPGYTVAGKTGTAQIPDPVHGGYIPGAYEATFAGFAPAENPVLSAIVVLERPTPIYGGIVAAPVFSQIMRYALHRYGIPTSPGGGSTGGTAFGAVSPGLAPEDRRPPAPRAPPHRRLRSSLPMGSSRKGRDRPRGSPIVRMDRLLEEVEVIEAFGDPAGTEVTAIEFDSRRVGPGALFCCLPGGVGDGHDHAADAVARGATALLVERRLALDVTQAVVAPGDARPAMAQLACAFFGQPARSLLTVGVTGTNGKTTVTHLLAAIFEAQSWPTTVIGTLDGARTTPESPVLQRLLAEARDDGPSRRGHGGVVARPGPGAGRRDPLRRRGLHQPVPRPSRLPRDHRRLLRRQGVAVHSGANGLGRGQRRRRLGTAHPRTRRCPDGGVLDGGGRCRRERGRSARRSGGADARSRWRWRERSTWPMLWLRRPPPRRWECPKTSSWPGSVRPLLCPGASRWLPPGPRSPWSSTTPTPPTGSRSCWTAPAGWRQGTASCASSGAGGTVTTRSAPPWAPSRRPVPMSWWSRRTTRGTKTPTPSSTRWSPAYPPSPRSSSERERADAIELVIDLAAPGDVVVVAGKGHEREIEIGTTRVPFDDRQVAATAVAGRADQARRGPGDRG